jgi:hypothetical protein
MNQPRAVGLPGGRRAFGPGRRGCDEERFCKVEQVPVRTCLQFWENVPSLLRARIHTIIRFSVCQNPEEIYVLPRGCHMDQSDAYKCQFLTRDMLNRLHNGYEPISVWHVARSGKWQKQPETFTSNQCGPSDQSPVDDEVHNSNTFEFSVKILKNPRILVQYAL